MLAYFSPPVPLLIKGGGLTTNLMGSATFGRLWLTVVVVEAPVAPEAVAFTGWACTPLVVGPVVVVAGAGVGLADGALIPRPLAASPPAGSGLRPTALNIRL